ncbi:hypothetical protein SAMN05421780_10471 [Flexibacter flexilis DSM 6793]|uniref:Uncharacterized protein n=1 Tax=Flexibacter flexilis DSM 6793 TaxID=927664 RepID=A0A1I1HS85_9BACT|nr:hypothetical protein SAMN05421780_10471 [Flexibacter flexilis DSM 6793]
MSVLCYGEKIQQNNINFVRSRMSLLFFVVFSRIYIFYCSSFFTKEESLIILID